MTTSAPFALRGDRPIESAEEDRLGRAPFAKAIAQQILEAPTLDSYVVAVMGPWGSGKTSLVNMVAEEARLRSDCVVLKFNPWIFSGAEQLVGYFFRELGSQLSELKNDRGALAGAALKRYAGLFGSVAKFVPHVGDAASKVADVVKDIGGAFAEGPSIESQRNSIRERLGKLDKRIVVVIDDIDRLRREEVRELVKLVRLTGDFPGIVYLLAFDRRRVESALGDDDETGRAYLEKIVQVAYDVPGALDADITQLLVEELNAAVEGIEHGPFGQMDWNNVFHGVIRPLFHSPRDVRRYVNAVPPTLLVIGKEVALPDVLALEAVRLFLPDVFAALPGLIGALTGSPGRTSARNDPHASAVKKLIEDAAPHGNVVREMIRRLFPLAERFLGGPQYGDGYDRKWHRDRRVAIGDVLRFYLERRLPAGVVAAAEVQAAFALLGDRGALVEMLDKMDPNKLENLLRRLEMFEDDFPPEHVEASIGALLDQTGRLREGRSHLFDLGAELVLDRVVLRLLRRREVTSEREEIIANVLPTLRSMSAMRELIRLVQGHKLADTQAIAAWNGQLAERVTRAAPEQLASERRLGALVIETAEHGGQDAERMRAVIETDAVLVRLLSSEMSEQSSWSMSDVASVQVARLPWRRLEEFFGKERLEARVREVHSRSEEGQLDERDKAAMDLAARFAAGWRPEDTEREEEVEGEPAADDDVPSP